MKKFFKGKVYLVIQKTTFDALTSEEKNKKINRSVSRSIDELKIVQVNSVDHYLFEVEEDELNNTYYFDEYEWYSREQILDKIT